MRIYITIIGLLFLIKVVEARNEEKKMLGDKAVLFNHVGLNGEFYNENSYLSSYYFIDKDGWVNNVKQGYNYFDTAYIIDSSRYDSLYGNYEIKYEKWLHEINSKVLYDTLNNALCMRNFGDKKFKVMFSFVKDSSILDRSGLWRGRGINTYTGDTIICINDASVTCWIFESTYERPKSEFIDGFGNFGNYYRLRLFFDKKNILPMREELYNYKDSLFCSLILKNSYVKEFSKIVSMDYKRLKTSLEETSPF
ncbi:hypothetical protein [Polluticaenibacter yanchengensis]|uniref:Uncharacterized protein n=1 Tax=Polluticaenibacter yanchengensis TaxID=3014562 RepID=A0ABT4UFA1_9BACT|nr:hypothetical protein [Chitinophagaceae bacterium LY-5]